MSENHFQTRWKSILEQCQLERIPRAELHLLAAAARQEDMRFLLEEGQRIKREWEAIRETDAGDVSDDYWRMATCVAETFRLIGTKAAPYLLAEVLDRNSPYRLSAARLLQADAAHLHREQVKAVLEDEADPEVRTALDEALKPPTSSPSKWKFWR